MESEERIEATYDAMILIVIRNLIKEIESQGKTFVTVDVLRGFIHNIETNTPVFGKKHVSEFDNKYMNHTVKYLVSCSKCRFEISHEEISLDKIKELHEEWNKINSENMECVHDYEYRLIS